MAALDELREERARKRALYMRARGSAYAVRPEPVQNIALVLERWRDDEQGVAIAGRLMARRGQGGLIFADLFDGSGTVQLLIKRDLLAAEEFELFDEVVDIGDFLRVCGSLTTTARGEKSLAVTSWQLIAKSLRPLPEKWHGLRDDDARFRHRYLESLMDEELRQRFILRARLIRAVRNYLEHNNFIEFETPILQQLPGGANARPFRTHHNALDCALYLRIAPELPLKELLIGGFPKVYELGRSFRNEGIDVTHNPEFTTVEWYEAYSHMEAQMERVEELMGLLVEELLGSKESEYGEHHISWRAPFRRLRFAELMRMYGADDTEGSELEERYKQVRAQVIEPTFVTHYPLTMLPLAHRALDDRGSADAFQLLAGGMELVKAFSELNDPEEQRERWQKEADKRAQGDGEAQLTDDDFLEALEYGMPPAGGVGIGIDRLTMLLSNTKNIREVIFFPTLKPKGN